MACPTWSSWFPFPVAASIMFLSLLPSGHSFVEKNTWQAPAKEKEVELRHNPQCALSVFRSMCSNSTWTSEHPPIPPLLLSDVRTNSIPDLPVVRNETVAVLVLPLTQYVAVLPKICQTWVYSFLYRVHQLVIGTYFFLFQLVEECPQVGAHVGECKVGTVCPEEAHCFPSMLR